jgi:N-acetylneuraminate synthase
MLFSRKPFFVAEVSSNHNRDLARCLRFVDVAAEIGCDAVKFQLFRVRELFAPEVLAASADHRGREKWELPTEFLGPIATRCRHAGIRFSCTPFYLKAVDELLPWVDFYKVASYELLWDDLLSACARTAKPVVLSTGMADISEIRRAVAVLRRAGCSKPTLLQCVSRYPAPPRQCNLAAMETLREKFECPVGWSDHSVSPAVIYRAAHRWGADIIEFHLDLEGNGAEARIGHCWLPDAIGQVIATVRAGLDTDGSGRKTPVPVEMPEREWRADPSDGLRPMLPKRAEFPKKNHNTVEKHGAAKPQSDPKSKTRSPKQTKKSKETRKKS